ncbi:HI0074 family nucleotidyltransferase substrate-binding subunit [Luteolibacter algae]|uniref:HI0074 family nucleotidyltransferase substrate-binding subunit n=1 Tax=Luteolibacter algae TaxID=454151 RepID=A0ABW5D9S2_9BACT
MSNTDPIRWKQRLQQFAKAEQRLSEALIDGSKVLNRLEQEGVIQRFEYTFELAWKVLKDLLFYEGFDVKSPREVIRQAFVTEYLNEDDTETALDALVKRNLLTHTYEEEVMLEALELIESQFQPMLHRLLKTLEKRAIKS